MLFEGTWRGIEALDEVDFVYDDDDMDVLGKKLKISLKAPGEESRPRMKLWIFLAD